MEVYERVFAVLEVRAEPDGMSAVGDLHFTCHSDAGCAMLVAKLDPRNVMPANESVGEYFRAAEFFDGEARLGSMTVCDCQRPSFTKVANVRPNKFPGKCTFCGGRVAAGAGVLGPKVGGRWTVRHDNGDCESGVVVTRFSSGAVVTRNRRGRCEDAPACGCCTY